MCQMKKIKIIVILTLSLAVFLTGILAAVYISMFKSGGTDVAFQSSDKQWADSEVQFKGRDFNAIVAYFYLYKILCNKPNVKLERLTKKPKWYTLDNFFNNYADPKRQIPLGVGNENTLSGYYPKATAKSCYNQPVSMADMNSAESQGKAFIANLKQHITVHSSGRP